MKKVRLKISAYIGGKLEKAGSIHELENGTELIEKGLAVEVANVVEKSTDAPTNAEIVAGLDFIDDEDKEFLLQELGEFKLELKKDGDLTKKSLEKVNEILPEGDE